MLVLPIGLNIMSVIGAFYSLALFTHGHVYFMMGFLSGARDIRHDPLIFITIDSSGTSKAGL